MTIKTRLILFALVSALLTAVAGASGYWIKSYMVDAMSSSGIATQALHAQMEADMMHDALRADVLAAMLAGSTGQSGEREHIRQELAEHIKTFREALAEIEALRLPPEVTQRLRTLRPALDAYIRKSEASTASAFDNPAGAAAELPAFMEAFHELEKEMDELSGLIENQVAQTKASVNATGSLADKLVFGILALAFTVFAVLSTLIISGILRHIQGISDAVLYLTEKNDLDYRLPALKGEFGRLADALNRFIANLAAIVGNVNVSAGSVSIAAGEIAAGNSDLSARTESQASSLEETASAMQELTGTVGCNADRAQEANRLALSACDVAREGGQLVHRAVGTMAAIKESSARINDITGVIDGIAFQTNILALNAAVEAARAGEQGRGFAVVATEVRSLAQRCAAAAKEIKVLIEDAVEKVETGSTVVDSAGATMQAVEENIRQVTGIIAEISAASREQTSGIEQISAAVVQIEEANQRNAALVEEAAAASASLREQAETLARSVGVFKLNSLGAGEIEAGCERSSFSRPLTLESRRTMRLVHVEVEPLRTLARQD